MKNTVLNKNIVLLSNDENIQKYGFANNKKEEVLIVVSKSLHDLSNKKELMNLWKKNGYIKEALSTSINMQTYVYIKNAGCYELYNPTITKDYKINFKKLYSWNQNNINKLVNECYKLANKDIYNLSDKNFNFNQFDKFNEDKLLSDKEFNKLYNKARKLFNKTHALRDQIGFKNFDIENCFISSNDLHGFYFPNIESNIRCIAFKNSQPHLIYDIPNEQKKYRAYINIDNEDYSNCEYMNPFWEEENIKICFSDRVANEYGCESTIELEELKALSKNKDYLILPVSIYDHSGVSFRIGDPMDHWDSWIGAYIVINKKALKQLNINYLDYANELVNGYNQYYNGEFYSYNLVEVKKALFSNEEEEIDVDSCSGYFNIEDIKREIESEYKTKDVEFIERF